MDPKRRVEAAIRKAWTYLEANQAERAIECFDEAIAADAASETVWLEKGVALYRLKRHVGAYECFEAAVARAPKSVTALVNRAKTLLLLGRREAALEGFEAVLALVPDHQSALLARGELLEMAGDVAGAFALYERAIAARPKEAEPWLRKGVAILRHGGEARREEALETITRAVELRPRYVDALHHRGLVLRALGRPKDAYRSFVEALKAEDAPDETVAATGDCALELGLARDALALAERILKRGQDSPLGWDLKSRAQAKLGSLASSALCAAMACMVVGRLDSALVEIERAIRIDPRYGPALSNRAVILERLGRPEEALEAYDRALALEPAAIPILLNRGALLLNVLRRRPDAIQCFRKVVRLDPRKWFDLPSDIRQEVDRLEVDPQAAGTAEE